MKRLFSFLILLLLISTADFFTQSIGEKLNDFMNNCYEQNEFNGVALIAKNQRILLHEPYGYADFEKKQKLTRMSMFYLASLSKQFTATAIVQLKVRGLLNYDDKINIFLKDMPQFMNDITIRHLLTHTSGIPDYYSFMTPKEGMTNKDVFDLITKLDSLEFKPGVKHSYSNSGYVLLAYIIENTTKKPFKLFMEREVFNRNGLLSTFIYDESKTRIHEKVKGYNKDSTLNDYNYLTYGAGGVYSNTEDLFIWDQQLYINIPVSVKEMEEAYKPMILNDSSKSYYGFGWRIEETDSGKILSHTGSLAGFRNFFERDLTNKNTIILLTNKECNRLKEIVETIKKIIRGEEYEYLKPLNNKTG